MGEIGVSKTDGVATVLIGNGRANSLTRAMLERLAGLLGELARDDDTGAVVVAGEGATFCAGSDIGELKALTESGAGPLPLLDLENAAFDLLAGLSKPTLAAVEGAATGGGAELAICCDLVVAGADARFCLPEIRLGVYPAAGAVLRLPRRIGHARALEMMLLGDEIDARAALSWGLANRVVEAGTALEETQRLARRLARGPHLAQLRLKEALAASRALTPQETQALVRRHSEELSRSPDLAEGMRAFFARERPIFGRKG